MDGGLADRNRRVEPVRRFYREAMVDFLRPRTVLIAAVARNGVIGRNGGLPWRQKTDLAHFKAATMGKPMIMGWRTWEAMSGPSGGPLPGRPHLVLSRTLHKNAAGAWTFASLAAALACARGMAIKANVSEVCVVGGADIFAAAMPLADALIITDILADAVGDVSFPSISHNTFVEASRTTIPAGPQDDHPCIIRRLDRVRDHTTITGP